MRSWTRFCALAVFLLLAPRIALSALICVDDKSDGTAQAGDCADTCDGTNDCSLRDAVEKANTASGADEIVFSSGVAGTIELAAALQSITDTLTITGPGADRLAVDANGNGVVFNINSATDDQSLTITGLTITGGGDTGLKNGVGDSLTLDGCVVTGNVGSFGGGLNPIGGDVTILNSAIHHNISGGHGGGLRINTPLASTLIRIVNTTISSNSAPGFGGGFELFNGTVELSNVTITGNSAGTDGGGFYVQAGMTLTFDDSLVVGNADAGSSTPDCGGPGTITSEGYNFVGNVTGCTFTAGTGDQLGKIFDGTFALGQVIDTVLAPNDGATPTHALTVGSPAIDAGNPAALGGSGACPVADQRGFNRAHCDIGAFEFGAAAAACGDGFVDAGEGCDDGNTDAGDGCDGSCQVEPEGTTGGETTGSGGTGTTGDATGGTSGGTSGDEDAGGCSLVRPSMSRPLLLQFKTESESNNFPQIFPKIPTHDVSPDRHTAGVHGRFLGPSGRDGKRLPMAFSARRPRRRLQNV